MEPFVDWKVREVMQLLILGGTRFVGRHLVEAALARGHELTLFNRGLSAPELFLDVEVVRGDREQDLSALAGRQWDAVIDTCGYTPRAVRMVLDALADSVETYVFISSIAVHADFSRPGLHEGCERRTPEDASEDQVTPRTYGPLKTLCEQALVERLPDRALLVRPGLIMGPHDPTDRFTYWPHRVAQGGEILAPGAPDRPFQAIDARDLADWTIRMVERKATGAYNATGPDHAMTFGEFLAEVARVLGAEARFTWGDDVYLQGKGVTATQLPFWVTAEQAGLLQVDCRQAIAAGLTLRPLEATIRDTVAWDLSRSPEHPWQAGLSPDRELALLEDLPGRAVRRNMG